MPGALIYGVQITVNGLIVSASTSQANLERRSRTD